MIITRTPFRISFAGGGSDLASFYHLHEGCVISSSINKYMYVSIHPSFNGEYTSVKYNKAESVSNIRELEHPIARQLLLDYKIQGVEINSIADVPSGTGLSTSSAYTVGLIHALKAYSGKYASQSRIAEEACRLEIDKLGEPIGKQDQYGTAIGGLKLIRFLPDDTVDVETITINPKTRVRLDNNLLLFYTGLTHSAGDILKVQSKNIETSQQTYERMVKMTELTKEMYKSLVDSDLDRFGEILHENWLLKKELSNGITNPTVEKYYDIAMNAGATGGKLLGAGGG